MYGARVSHKPLLGEAQAKNLRLHGRIRSRRQTCPRCKASINRIFVRPLRPGVVWACVVVRRVTLVRSGMTDVSKKRRRKTNETNWNELERVVAMNE